MFQKLKEFCGKTQGFAKFKLEIVAENRPIKKGLDHRPSHDDVSTTLCEERTLSVELLSRGGTDQCDRAQIVEKLAKNCVP